MPEPQFIDAPAPKFVDSEGPKFIDAPSPQESGFQPTKYGFGVKQGEAPTGGPATIREDGAINFPGQSNWNFWDPKTQRYAPAPSEPWANKGVASTALGSDTLSHYGRNLKAGWDKAMGGVYDLGSQVATAVGIQSPESRMDAVRRINEGIRQAQALKNTGGSTASNTQLVGETAPAVAMTALTPEVEGAGFLANAGRSAGMFGLGTAATTTGTPTERTLAGTVAGGTQLGLQAGLSKVVSPALATVGNAIGNKLPKVGAFARATAEALGLGGTSETPWADAGWGGKYRTPEATKYLEDLKANNIEATPSQIKAANQPPDAAIVSAENAVNKIKDTLTKNMNDMPYSVGELPKVAQTPGPYQARAQAILDEAAKEGDPTHVLTTSADMKAFQEKLRLKGMADVRASLADGVAVDPAKPLGVLKQWRDEVSGTDASKWPQKQSVLDKIDQTEAALKDISRNVPTKILDEQGNPITRTVDRPNSFLSMARTRSDVGDEIAGFYKGSNSEVGSKGANYLQAFKNSINEAMSDAAQNSGKPALAAADKAFNADYSKYMGSMKDPEVLAVLKNPTPDTLMGKLANAGPIKAQKIMDALDPKGQAAYAAGVVNDAFGNAVNKRTRGAMIPGNITAGVKDVEDALGVTVKDPAMRSKIDSLVNVLAGLARSNPQQASALGQRITGSAIAAADHTGLASMVADATKRGHFIDWAFNSPAGKDFLFKIKGLPPESPMLQQIAKEDLPKFLVTQAGQTTMQTAKTAPIAGKAASSVNQLMNPENK